ncbi:aminotransferase class I/II-fold pyridoxal phosphate-dependent enzyme [Adhaeretor mobilis]|uniref:Long-chain-fatty-acid--AMP ligase FadD32 n=1 Tax=Adhaeretor mobilis TaxID=1930276 RepID=A0A517MZ79_9BACT|nr:aminotransferase class I/II-fold pyridoxal phosphate-dependent enzyme [Adhaeretor mobilis]QDT00118.1 Long-chain-fatty-acid--AMP ligase FadD32 [Adhaeretor mobilis]
MNQDQLPGSFFGPSTLVELLQHRAAHQGDDIGFRFLVDGEKESIEWTYAGVDRKARAIAASLQAMGLEGERALLLYPSGLDFVAAFFGCLYAGVTAVPAYPPRRNRNMARIQAIANDASAAIALTTSDVLERVQIMISDTPVLQQMRWRATDQWEEELSDSWTHPDVHGDTLAFLQYTSGSTGTPKGVMLTHSNLMHNSAMIAYAFEHSRSGSGVFWLPLYHDMGLIGGILQPLYMGRPNMLFSPTHFLQRPLRWLQIMTQTGATISGGPNFAYDLCAEKITSEQKKQLDLSRWSLAFNGAEPVRAETMDRFSEAFAECGFRKEAFYPCYGLAEATLIVAGGYKQTEPVVRTFDIAALEEHRAVGIDASDKNARRLVGSGGNLLDQNIVIADPKTFEAREENQVGEIWVSGPSVAQGYWKREEISKDTFQAKLSDGRGPFLRTGDLGFLSDGELFVTGRLKDLIILRGVNHYPQDIELTVDGAHEHLKPGAGAAFAVGPDGEERLVVAQETNRRRDMNVGEIFDAIRKQVANSHELAVSAIVLLKTGSIPKTSSGKIQRHACQAGYQAGTLAALAMWTAEGGIQEIAASVRRTTDDDAQLDSDGMEAAADVIDDEGLEDAAASSVQETIAPKPLQKKSVAKKPLSVEPAQRNGAIAKRSGSKELASKPQAAGDQSEEGHELSAQQQDIAEKVFEQVRLIGKERAKDLEWSTNIVEMGLDSLERMEIVAALEDAFGGRFPDHVLPNMETCGEVVEAIEEHLGGKLIDRTQPRENLAIPEENYIFAQSMEYRRLQENKKVFTDTGRKPFFTVHEGVTNDRTTIDGQEYINFCSYNYLGMSGDPVVTKAARDAVQNYGTSVSASRLVSGEKPLHGKLERGIADFIGTEEALVFVGGHSTNESVIGHMFGPGDLILHDALSHNSIMQGAILSGARRRPFPHNDWEACGRILREIRHEYQRVLIVVEGVYSMDGDYPELPKFVEIKKEQKAYLMVDEAHSIGTMGRRGRGMVEHFDLNPRDVDVWMGTLSKSFGSCGGYIAGQAELIDYLKYTAPGFVFSVGLSPANAGAALASLELLQDEPERVAKLAENSRLFLELAQAAGLDTGTSNNTAVVPVIMGSSPHAMALSTGLFDRGINVQPIIHPAVEESAARLRFFITTDHTTEQIRQTVRAVAEELDKIDPTYRKGHPLPSVATHGVAVEPVSSLPPR